MKEIAIYVEPSDFRTIKKQRNNVCLQTKLPNIWNDDCCRPYFLPKAISTTSQEIYTKACSDYKPRAFLQRFTVIHQLIVVLVVYGTFVYNLPLGKLVHYMLLVFTTVCKLPCAVQI